jgi:hypothetical protein
MYELPDADVRASRKDWLTIVWKLAQTLDTLQSFSLGLKSLDINSVMLGCRNEKVWKKTNFGELSQYEFFIKCLKHVYI